MFWCSPCGKSKIHVVAPPPASRFPADRANMQPNYVARVVMPREAKRSESLSRIFKIFNRTNER